MVRAFETQRTASLPHRPAPFLLGLLIVALTAPPGAQAVEAADPIVVDPSGDALVANEWADLTALWITETAQTLDFLVEVAKLPSPPSGADSPGATTGTAYLVLFQKEGRSFYAGFMSTVSEEFHAGEWNQTGFPETSSSSSGTVTYGSPGKITIVVPRPAGDRISNVSLVAVDFKLALYELAVDEDAFPALRSLAYVLLDEARTDHEFRFRTEDEPRPPGAEASNPPPENGHALEANANAAGASIVMFAIVTIGMVWAVARRTQG